ncbi:tyrosinase cofactor [Streptomyces sp. C11-1]|uniref:Tyrosinase cofactor n=1 Tax=Streptomyces durocortorensis TaxID=2811104 RepID=A0ABY9VNP5_9ACTN|nr:tyrosinase cofactor [Streptomyces durocortorensis]WNF25453.1 tyrosinase cofactor [Streptomyces durocortorensis]
MSRITRRRALGASAGALAGLAVAGVASAAGPSATPAPRATAAERAAFDEVYQGRRIQGAPSHHGGHHDHGSGYQVHIDGKELHVMRNADGTWISVVNHYETFATPLAVARAAVAELQGAALVPLALA